MVPSIAADVRRSIKISRNGPTLFLPYACPWTRFVHFTHRACTLCTIGDAAMVLVATLAFPLVTHGGDNGFCFGTADACSFDSLRGVEFVAADGMTSWMLADTSVGSEHTIEELALTTIASFDTLISNPETSWRRIRVAASDWREPCPNKRMNRSDLASASFVDRY
jgi:hypothetical protein